MKFKNTKVTDITSNILFNDHFVSMNYDCSDLTDLADEDGVIPAGTVIPANDSTAVGVLFSDVCIDENPNGAIVIHGFINSSKLPVEATETAKTALSLIKFIDNEEEDGE